LADVKAGVDAWSAGNYQQAVAEWQEPAAQGDADALFNLAQAYRLGRGVTTDNVRARKLYEEAARRGHVKAADNFGLMLFQDGEQDKAMPLIRAAADRGDPRAQYVLGLSHFNADYAPRDWVRAYALMTLASSAGLPQAKDALGQMDQYVPQVQRSQAQSLAREIDAAAKGQRAADLAAADLGAGAPTQGPAVAVSTRASAATPVPVATPVAMPPLQTGRPASEISALPATVVRSAGRWRVQLGAFGVAANADRLWNQLASHAALAGTQKTLIPSGKLTRLLATGFTSEAEASRACTALKREGQACVVAGQG
jgi:cell division septation protein DedD